MNVVPFSVGSLYGGVAECEGLLRDEGEVVFLEYRVKDSIAGIFRGSVKRLRVPVGDLISVTFTGGWLGAGWLGRKLVLQATSLEVFRDVPGSHQGRVELTVARKHHDVAEQLVSGLHVHRES